MIRALINGVDLQAQVPGLLITQIGGREFHENELTSQSIETNSGSFLINNRIPERRLQIAFRLIASSKLQWWSVYNNLTKVCTVEEAQIIFSDETDKYWTATTNRIELDEYVGPGFVYGKITFLCCDPFKRATAMKEVSGTANGGAITLTVNNEGNVPAELEYEVKPAQENGFLYVASGHGAMEFGSRSEADTTTQTGLTVGVASLSDFMAVAQGTSYQMKNVTKTFWVDGSGTSARTGLTLGTTKPPNASTLAASKTVNLTNPMTHMDCYFYAPFVATSPSQTGYLSLAALDAQGGKVCEVLLTKSSTSSNRAYFKFRVNGKEVYSKAFDAIENGSGGPENYENGYATHHAHGAFQREGATFRVYYFGSWYSFDLSGDFPELKTKGITRMRLTMGSYNTNTPVRMEVYSWDVRDTNGKKVTDVQNRFRPNQILKITEDGKFYKNGVYSPDQEVVGSRFFKAPPGETKIQIGFSTWFSGMADVKVRWRERWR